MSEPHPTGNAMLPIIRQMNEAGDDRARADLLLRCPDAILNKYEEVYTAACRRAGFEAGEAFIAARVACLHAVRGAAGGLPAGLALAAETLRAEMARYAAGAPVHAAPPTGPDPPPSPTDL